MTVMAAVLEEAMTKAPALTHHLQLVRGTQNVDTVNGQETV